MIITGVAVMAASRFVDSHPLSCRSCHPALYSMWEASKVHPKDKSDCTDCHVKGKYQAKPLYLADQNTVDNQCESCHQDIWEKDTVENVKLIKFSHRKHLNENITCFTCHKNIAHDKESPATNRPRKKVCLNCHIREIEGSLQDEACMMCHYIILDQRTSLFAAQKKGVKGAG